jgi:hypothetical protein
MSFKRLEILRQRPENSRRAITLTLSVLMTLLILVLWLANNRVLRQLPESSLVTNVPVDIKVSVGDRLHLGWNKLAAIFLKSIKNVTPQ